MKPNAYARMMDHRHHRGNMTTPLFHAIRSPFIRSKRPGSSAAAIVLTCHSSTEHSSPWRYPGLSAPPRLWPHIIKHHHKPICDETCRGQQPAYPHGLVPIARTYLGTPVQSCEFATIAPLLASSVPQHTVALKSLRLMHWAKSGLYSHATFIGRSLPGGEEDGSKQSGSGVCFEAGAGPTALFTLDRPRLPRPTPQRSCHRRSGWWLRRPWYWLLIHLYKQAVEPRHNVGPALVVCV